MADLRKEYSGKGLRESDMQADPMRQFEIWMDQILETGNPEPTAMVLATADRHGQVSARMVLLKKVNERGFYFFTNYQSHKAVQLDENAQAALLFYWPELERQVRVEGTVSRITRQESDNYFRTRPAGSQLSAWASPQSRVIPDTGYMHQMVEEYRQRFMSGSVSRPDFWGGYCLSPARFEFWQGKADRLHDRITYRLEDRQWVMERLAP